MISTDLDPPLHGEVAARSADAGVSPRLTGDTPPPPPAAVVPLRLQGRNGRLLILLLVALVMRALDLGNPVIHVDEEFYFVTARAMAHGGLPFVDVWDRKPIGLFLLYLPAAMLPWRWGIVAYQLAATLSAVATAWLVAGLADRAGWSRGATAAGVAYIVWLDLLGGVGGQAPVFFNLLMAGAGTLALNGRRAGVAAMALVGLALQVKYSVVFEGVALGLWLLWRHWHGWVAALGQALLLVTVALGPTAAALATYAALGQAPAFVFANFTSILARGTDLWTEQLGNAATLVLILSPLVAMAFAGGAGTPVRRVLRGWFVVALAGVALFGSWFDHYGLPVLVPGCACAAGFLAERRRLGHAILALAAVTGLARVAIDRSNRGNGAQLDAIAAAVGRGRGCLYVYSGETMLYPATGRCAATRWLFPSHLTRTREAGAVGIDQPGEVLRILATAPDAIVMRPPYRGERLQLRASVLAALQPSYRLAAQLPMGREIVAVWRRTAPPASPPAGGRNRRPAPPHGPRPT